MSLTTGTPRLSLTNSSGSKALSPSSPRSAAFSMIQNNSQTLSSGAFSTGASSDASRCKGGPTALQSLFMPAGSSQCGSASINMMMPATGSFGSARGSGFGSFTYQKPGSLTAGALGDPLTPIQTPRQVIQSPMLSPRSLGSTLSHSSVSRPRPSTPAVQRLSSVQTTTATSSLTSKSNSANVPVRMSSVAGQTTSSALAGPSVARMSSVVEGPKVSTTTTSVSSPSPVPPLSGLGSLGGVSQFSSPSQAVSRMTSLPNNRYPSPLKVRDASVFTNDHRPTDHLSQKLSALKTATKSFSTNLDNMLNSWKDEMNTGPATIVPEYVATAYSGDRAAQALRSTPDKISTTMKTVMMPPLRMPDMQLQGAWQVDTVKSISETTAARAAVEKAADSYHEAVDLAIAAQQAASLIGEQVVADTRAKSRQRSERAAAVQAAAQKLAAIRQGAGIDLLDADGAAWAAVDAGLTNGLQRQRSAPKVERSNQADKYSMEDARRGKLLESGQDSVPAAREAAEKARITLTLAADQLAAADRAVTDAAGRPAPKRQAGEVGPSRWEMAVYAAMDQVAMLQSLALADLEMAEDASTFIENCGNPTSRSPPINDKAKDQVPSGKSGGCCSCCFSGIRGGGGKMKGKR